MEGIKKLIGNRVYLEIPKQEETKIIVDHNTKEDLKKEFLKSMNRLKVVAVGEGVGVESGPTRNIPVQVGDIVLVDPSALARAPIIPINEKLDVTCVNYYDIQHIWE